MKREKTKYWPLKMPVSIYEQNVKALAAQMGISIIDERQISLVNQDLVIPESERPKVSLKSESKRKKTAAK